MTLVRAELLKRYRLGARVLVHDPSLVGYWPFDRDDGSYARDRSGYLNHGTIVGASKVPGKVGGALNFDGATQYVRVPHNAVLNCLNELTTTIWVRKTAFTGAFETYFEKNTCYECYLNAAGKPSFAYHDGASWRTLVSLTVLPLNVWVHLGVTQKASGANTLVKLYRNGALDRQSTLTGRPTANTLDLIIGSHYTLPSLSWMGDLDEPGIRSRAVSDAEMARIMNIQGI